MQKDIFECKKKKENLHSNFNVKTKTVISVMTKICCCDND